MNQKQPFFSIIIPTYARPRQLAACLQALTRLAYPPQRFEAVVVDDGSENPLEGVVDPFRNQLNVILLSQPNAGPASARNTGASQAKGTFLAFTDDDCAPAPDWLKNFAKRFAATPDCAIGGRTLNRLPDNPFSTASQILIDYLYNYYNSDHNRAQFFASNNLALPKERFLEMGGFDTTFPCAAGEDRELCDRWLNHGRRMIYAPEALVWHSHSLTGRNFWKQHFGYGRGAYFFQQARLRHGHQRIRLERLSFYLNLLRAPFRQTISPRALVLAALLVLSQGANAAGYFTASGDIVGCSPH